MSASYSEAIANATGQQVTSIQERKVASLWAGYGTVARVTAQLENGTTQRTRSYIAKRVAPPPAAGVGHNRKIKSYQVEATFYANYAKSALHDACIRLPEPIAISSPSDSKVEFLLSDLSADYPTESCSYSLEEAKVALAWLARFHAFFWERPCDGLWPEGCYWHLATRLEELQQISGSWRQLQDLAHRLNERLKGDDHPLPPGPARTCKHRTIVHGDFKAANIVFSEDGSVCAAYDFQYVGGGFGTKDVAYLLCSSVDGDVVAEHEEQLLRHYHTQLHAAYAELRSTPLDYSYGQMTIHYGLSMLDYVRFMAGWGFWGNSAWAQRKARALLQHTKALQL